MQFYLPVIYDNTKIMFLNGPFIHGYRNIWKNTMYDTYTIYQYM